MPLRQRPPLCDREDLEAGVGEAAGCLSWDRGSGFGSGAGYRGLGYGHRHRRRHCAGTARTSMGQTPNLHRPGPCQPRRRAAAGLPELHGQETARSGSRAGAGSFYLRPGLRTGHLQ